MRLSNDLLAKSIKLLDNSKHLISDILPSKFATRRYMTSDVSSREGYWSYDVTPYTKEIIDCLSPESPARIVAVIKGAQIGFAQPLSTLIPTPSGWTTMRKIKVGDKVFGENGFPCVVEGVTDVMYNHKCYDVYFSDGSIVKCDMNHLWEVWDEKSHKRRKKVVLTTEEISNTFVFRVGRTRYAINVTEPLELPDKDLLIHPYVLGLWLGNGSHSCNALTINEDDEIELINNIRECRYNVYSSKASCKGKALTLRLSGNEPFITSIKRFNVFENKHIPDVYLRASKEQRLDLLRGLMDSDGHINKNGNCEFYNTNLTLIKQTYELLMTLGIKARVTKRLPNICEIIKGNPCNTKDIYLISFRAFREMPVSKMERKIKNQKYKNNCRHTEITRRRIIDVKECESVPVKCIKVSNPSHLYLTGESMIPTHNTAGVIENGIAWLISEAPGPTIFMCGDKDMTQEFIEKRVDQAVDSCGIRHLLRSSALRVNNRKSGDTAKSKEFAGGFLVAEGVNNPNKLRGRSFMYGFIDDFDAAKIADKKEGSFRKLLEKRFASYYYKMKLFYISTPTVKGNSNIEEVYDLGDKRHYNVPCPCCGDMIVLKWKTETKDGQLAGIYFELNDHGKLIDKSVGYVCQSCGEFFTEKHKYDMMLHGEWVPTAEPSEDGYRSYHIPSLLAPPGNYNWAYYVREFLECYPNGIHGKANTTNLKTFVNTCLGETFEEQTKMLRASQLSMNTREYSIGSIPMALSEKDGNGSIVMLTCACDMNGKQDDARLDYEVVAWCESGSSYSIDAGSIGTFQRGLDDKNREMYTYRLGEQLNVWDFLLRDVLTRKYYVDEKNDKYLTIYAAGIDTGMLEHLAFSFIDQNQHLKIPALLCGLKGDPTNRARKLITDSRSYKLSKEKNGLYLLESNQLKDDLADRMDLRWNPNIGQPSGFMNFPTPSEGKYTTKGFFIQFEAEHRLPELSSDGSEIGYKWTKKNGTSQNHYWDCRYYNLALKEVYSDLYCREFKVKHPSWAIYCDLIKGSK